jgi:uncharacterized protein YcnI
MVRNTLRRAGAVGAVAAAILLATAIPAAAHITVNPKEAAQGGYAKLAFRVPNERDASTTKVEVVFPEKQPFASVSVRPMPGWKIEVTKAKLATPIKAHDREITEAVSRITWTADSPATAIQAGQFQEFEVSAGPMPENADELVFKALQTYTGGEVVRWIEEQSGSEEPEHPAPVLKLTKAESDDHHADGATAEEATAGDASASGGSGEDDGPSGIAIAGLVAGVAGLVLAALALVRTRKTS